MAPKKKTTSQVPNWPALNPLMPESDIALEELVPNQIVTIPNLWTPSLCKTYVSFLSSLPLTTTPGKPKKGSAVRVNDRFQIDDAAFADKLWTGTALKRLVMGAAPSDQQRKELWGGDVVGLNPNIRIYRYSSGQFFDQHYDESNNVTMPGCPPVAARTTWTLLLYLTSPATGCIGGETVFYPDLPKKKSKVPPPEPIAVGLQVGLALLHRHGADCMLHEGREVTSGEKWVIRTDLCVRR
ncbi:hypothetical protein CFE70_006209 [Pyrenophora teres f. teres 0-1]|uniref:Fe2OG dioxygenase domain-containing protein n=2 Tax=Pyrenophora teres f. teres TaxID=97479 RepID=E3REE4_PYRTT|nr:hypothetical protein PTT_04363 [Pyrenophora teres f. teres 0-1]KAE8838306.1 hypothetical protein HRS9139_02689 [Pyrenophora teres f. teres]KAE8844267.1 hypothetical protein PTNB85_02532 [Pyrenophora teres f. teres]CAE7180002.1 2OG-FeII Oxy 3 domain containing protein [Pyrenophora teres f. teres]